MNVTTPQLRFIVMDTLLSLGRAAQALIPTPESDLLLYDAIIADGQGQPGRMFSEARSRGRQLTHGAIAVVLHSILLNWYQGSHRSLAILMADLEMTYPELLDPTKGRPSRLLGHLILVMESLTEFDGDDNPDPEPILQAAEGLHALTKHLELDEHWEVAVACLLDEQKFRYALDDSPAIHLPLARLTLTLARRARSPRLIGFSSLRLAQLLRSLPEKDQKSNREELLNAIELTLFHLDAQDGDRKTNEAVLAEVLRGGVGAGAINIQLRLFGIMEANDPDGKLELVRTALTPVWGGTVQEFIEGQKELIILARWYESQWLSDLGTTSSKQVETRWSTWTITHPRLFDALPLASSLDRVPGLSNLLLEVNHEVTHVYSLMGVIGMAGTALRWAAFEQELNLWGRRGVLLDDESHFLDRHQLAPLPDPSALTDASALAILARVEQIVGIARKIQLLELAWTPWFEGLAVFGELAEDPVSSTAYSPPMTTVLNLWDADLVNEAAKNGTSIEEAARQVRQEAEAKFAASVERVGPARLRAYLDPNHSRYLIGYLVVRSMVATWRQNAPGAFTGSQAFRVLLHATRFHTPEILPSLDLDPEDFGRELLVRQVRWLNNLAATPWDDLEKLAGSATTNPSAVWQDGRVVYSAERTRIDIDRWVRDAMNAPISGPDRIRLENNPIQNAYADAISSAMSESDDSPRLLRAESAGNLVNRHSILPLGQADCRFWLIPKSRSVAVLIRTPAAHEQEELVGWSMQILVLPQESFDLLYEEYQAIRIQRIRVTRVADVADRPHPEGGGFTAAGNHAFWLEYGRWTHCFLAGLFFGKPVTQDLAENIRSRLSPHLLLADWEAMFSDEQPGIRRVAEWLNRFGPWQLLTEEDPNFSVTLKPWGLHLITMTNRILNGDSDYSSAVRQQLMAAAFPAFIDSDAVIQDGLRGLTADDPGLVGRLVKALFYSAQVPDHPGLGGIPPDTVDALFMTSDKGWDVAPFPKNPN